jgi:hypothetical protein
MTSFDGGIAMAGLGVRSKFDDGGENADFPLWTRELGFLVLKSLAGFAG